MNYFDIYKGWGIPVVKIGNGLLVARVDAKLTIKAIVESRYHLLGYDCFTVLSDGKRQPHINFCASFSKDNQPSVEQVINSIKSDPIEITHYEFVFST